MELRERTFARLLSQRPPHTIAANTDARAACAILEKLIAAEAYGIARGMGDATPDDPLFFISREEAYHVRIGDAVLALFGRTRRAPQPSAMTRVGVRAMSLLPSFFSGMLVYWGERFGSRAFMEAASRILPALPEAHRAYADALFLSLLRDEAEHTAWAHFSLGRFQRVVAELVFPLFSRFASRELSTNRRGSTIARRSPAW